MREKQRSSFLGQDSSKTASSICQTLSQTRAVYLRRVSQPVLCPQSLHHEKHVLNTGCMKHRPSRNCTYPQSSTEVLMGPMVSGCTEALPHLLILHDMLSALCTWAGPSFLGPSSKASWTPESLDLKWLDYAPFQISARVLFLLTY